MQIEIKDIDYCLVSVDASASKEEIEAKKDEVITQQFAKRAVPGVRPGKTPDPIAIKMHYAKQISQALERALAEQAFHNTVTEHNIKPFGVPEFKSLELDHGKSFKCTFTLRKKPDVKLEQYKELSIPKPHADTTIDVAAQQMLQDFRIRYGEAIPYENDDFVQMTDNVIIDYDVYDGDRKVEALSIEGELLTVGRSMLDGFDANLLGMKITEKREFYLKEPDTGLPSLAGKELKFKVAVIMGSKIKPMPLDDTLAQKMEKKDLQELTQFATDYASARLQEKQRQNEALAISNKLVADHNIRVPEWLTQSEAQYLVASAKIEWGKLAPEDQAQYMKMAENNVKLSLIFDKIREEEPETQLSDSEVISTIQGMVQKAAKTPEEVDGMMNELNKTGQIVVLAARVRDEFTQDFLLKSTKWIE